MVTQSPTAAVVTLSLEQCWELLATNELGRLAVSVSQQPEIFPVNYAVQDTTLLFRTAPGTKLAALTVNKVVVLEIDGYDEASGWSVIVKGHAKGVAWGADTLAAESAPLRPWVPTDKPVFVRIYPNEVTGRGFRFDDPPELF